MAGVNTYATSHERTTWKYYWEARWSPTDAALAFYLARSAGNDKLKAHYQRVRTAQKLINVVEASYYRLLATQQALPMAVDLVEVCSKVAAKVDRLLAEGLSTVEDHHKGRQRLIKARSILASLESQHSREMTNLTSAMAISPAAGGPCQITLAGGLSAPYPAADPCELEMAAVMNRPEAYQAGLNHLNSVNDLKRTIIKYFPKVTGFWRGTGDKDKFLLNKEWKEIGMYASIDVVDWISNIDESRATTAITRKTGHEVAAIALGITTEVRLAAVQFREAMDKIASEQESLKSTETVLRMVTDKLDRDVGSDIAVEEARANVLLERIELIKALGEANAALAALYAAAGTNYSEPRPRTK